jgi:hypothetical protein
LDRGREAHKNRDLTPGSIRACYDCW